MRARRKTLATAALAAALAAALLPASAAADFGLQEFDTTFTNRDGTAATQAGSHPFATTNSFRVNFKGTIVGFPEGRVRDALFQQVKGLVGDADAIARCTTIDFAAGDCALDSVVGLHAESVINPVFFSNGPIFNLVPPPGIPVRLAWKATDVEVPVILDIGVKRSPDYNVIAATRNTNETLAVLGSVVQIWGVPADPAHDVVRGTQCASNAEVVENKRFAIDESEPCEGGEIEAEELPFLTLPRACEGPLSTDYEIRSWEAPGNWLTGSVLTHDNGSPPEPQGFTGCAKVDFAPQIDSDATTDQAATGSGLEFSISFNQEGLLNPKGIAQSEIKKTEITLPEGVTINASIGEGLQFCTPSDLDDEELTTDPGDGCPNGSKIGTVAVQTPLLAGQLEGSVYLAEQDDPSTSRRGAENPFDTDVAFYIVLKDKSNGLLVKLPAKVTPDPETGRLVTTVEDIPQLPFSRFEFRFREGTRPPLITPSRCGTYTTEATFTPWASPGEEVDTSADFEIERGVGGGPCPSGPVEPFQPGFVAGSIDANAASYSPFVMRLTRRDGEQDMTKFSAVLPPGVLGRLAGVAKCPQTAVEAAKLLSGKQQRAMPGCPAASAIGRTLAGAGVGNSLTYVPGTLYLGGPYRGAPLSVISVTPAVAGPFDAGTVVVQVALDLNPETAEVEVDGAASDPIPHILKGIPLKLRDLRVYVDRPDFILNPTGCRPSLAQATLWGSFLDPIGAGDDMPVGLQTRYQAANCASLPFKPRLKLALKGGTRRGAHPALRAVLRMNPADANIRRAVVTLPRSAFLDQAHIRTICTRVQFAAGPGNGALCPPAGRYGYVKAWTPLLDEPIEGPVWLRSSDNELPDLVASLHGLVDVNVSSRIDSSNGRIRSTFEAVPDAPVSRFVLRMQGGKKGLIVNSRNLCVKPKRNRARANFTGQNGGRAALRPIVRPSCGKKRKPKRSAHRPRVSRASAQR